MTQPDSPTAKDNNIHIFTVTKTSINQVIKCTILNNLSVVYSILSIKELTTDNAQGFHNTHNLDSCHHRVKRFKLTRTQTVRKQINWFCKLGGAEPDLNTIPKHDCI